MNSTFANCSLPETNRTNIRNILSENNMKGNFPLDESDGYDFNCWGFVAFFYGWEQMERWLDSSCMNWHLEKNTRSISKEEVTAGDIAVFRRFGNLTHTALMTSNPEVVCHKPGASALCVDTMEHAKYLYGDVSFVRPFQFHMDKNF